MKKIEQRPFKDMFDFSGRKAVVTGAAQGLGFEISKRLSEVGASVLMTDINPAKIQVSAQKLTDQGANVESKVVDAGSEADIIALFEYAADSFGGIDILVNNAGIYPVDNVLEMPTERWRAVLKVNLESAFLCTREAGRRMVDQARGGVIINMSSLGGIKSSFVGMAHYEASKGGIINLTMSTALELAPHGIRAIAIAPGMILTEGVQANLSGGGGGSVDEMLEDFGSRIPLGRFGHPDDIARTVVFLASDAADYITGTTIVVDGGKLLT